MIDKKVKRVRDQIKNLGGTVGTGKMTNVMNVPEITEREVKECIKMVDDPEFEEVWEWFGTLNINPIEIPHDKQVESTQDRYRQIPLQYHKKLSALLKQMVAHGKIEKVDLEKLPYAWLSNPHITEMKNGDIRLNLDARRPNKVIIDNAEPMPTP